MGAGRSSCTSPDSSEIEPPQGQPCVGETGRSYRRSEPDRLFRALSCPGRCGSANHSSSPNWLACTVVRMEPSTTGDAAGGSGSFRIRGTGYAPQSREAILVATAEVIADRGFESARISDISERSGIPISTLEYQFGSREDLLYAAFQHLAFQELREMSEAMRAGEDAWDRLRAFMEISMMENEDTQFVWRSWVEYWRAAVRDARVREDALEVYRQWRGFVEQVVRQGVEQGRFSVTLDSDAVAFQISAVVDGMSVPLVTRDGGLRELKHSVTEVVVDAVARIVGLQPLPGGEG